MAALTYIPAAYLPRLALLSTLTGTARQLEDRSRMLDACY